MFRDGYLKQDADLWRDELMEAAAKESNGALIDEPEDPKPILRD